MPVKQESLNRDLYGILKSRGYRPDMFTSAGKKVAIPDEAEVFQFDFVKDGKNYGKVTATIDGLHRLIIYYGDDVAASPKADTTHEGTSSSGESFTHLLKHLKRFAKNKQLGFELSDQDDLEPDMAKREHVKSEGLNEGYYPMGKTKSYSDNVQSTKIILQHNRQLEEGEQRYRNIAKIFVENQLGERFLLPTNKPGLARVYARHISEGGTPYDERGHHITSLCEEYNKMAGFVRATKNKQFNESAQKLINEGINHYTNLRETLHKLAGKRGYSQYFESYTPALMEEEGADLSEMFMQSSLDPRIESVMPILSKLSNNISEATDMLEVAELAEWADTVSEGDVSRPMDEPNHNNSIQDRQKKADTKRFMQGVKEDQLDELFEPSANYYTLSNGKMVQVDYKPGIDGQSPAPLTDVKVSYVNPALKPQGSSFNSTGQAERWDKAPDGIKQAIQKFVTQPQQGVAEGSLNEVTQGVEHSEWADNVRDAYPSAKIIKKRTEDGRHIKSQAILNGQLVGQYNMNTGVGTFKSPKQQGVAEGLGNFAKAIDNLHGWYQDDSSDPNIERYEFDDREGGYYAYGTIEHNLKTGEIAVDFEDKSGEYDGDIKATFNSIGDAMNALRRITTQHRYNTGKAQSFDRLGDRTLAGPDDVYKTDRAGKKGTLTKSRMDTMKMSSPYRKTGPKGVLPEQGVAEGKKDKDDDLIGDRYTQDEWDRMLERVKQLAHKQEAEKKANQEKPEQKTNEAGPPGKPGDYLDAKDTVSTGKILGNTPQTQHGLRGKLVGESDDPLIKIKKLSGL